MAGVESFLQHTPIELQPGQLAVVEPGRPLGYVLHLDLRPGLALHGRHVKLPKRAPESLWLGICNSIMTSLPMTILPATPRQNLAAVRGVRRRERNSRSQFPWRLSS